MYCNYAEGVRLLGMLRSYEGERSAKITRQDMITVAHWFGIYNILDYALPVRSYMGCHVKRLEFHDLCLDQQWIVDYDCSDDVVLDWQQLTD